MSDVNVTALTIGLSVAAGVILILVLLVLICDRGYRRRSLKGRHVVVTGGSSGIGKAMACLAAKEGAKVTIVARNQVRLDQAKQEVQEKSKSDQVRTLSADLCCDPQTVKDALSDIGNDTDPYGPVFMLVNCAGSAIPGRFEEANDSDFKRMMDLNYFGSVWTTRALLPSLKASPDGASIVFVSSQAALVGIYGYSAYAPSKYAVRGLAEVLSMEVAPFDITVTVGFPPDTDTPGFEEENKGKPEETKLLSETAGLFSPTEVAK